MIRKHGLLMIKKDEHKNYRIAFARKAWEENLRYFTRNERASEFIVSHSFIETVDTY